MYPSGAPLHDAGQLKLLGRLRGRLPAHLDLRTEVPLNLVGDQRAFDAVVTGPGLRVAFELIARLEDAQAVERAVNQKRRDAAMPSLILVFAESRHNRAAMRAAHSLRRAFPIAPRAVLAAMQRGRQPQSAASVFL